MKKIWLLLSAVLLLLVFVLELSVYPVSEQEVGVLTHHQASKSVLLQPGWHLKWPFWDHLELLDLRPQILSLPVLNLKTADGKSFDISIIIRWQLQDPQLFSEHFKGALAVNQRLQDLLSEQLNTLLQGQSFQDVILKDRLSHLMQVAFMNVALQAKANGLLIKDLRLESISLAPSTLDQLSLQVASDLDQKTKAYRLTQQAADSALLQKAKLQADHQVSEAAQAAQDLRLKTQVEILENYGKEYEKAPGLYRLYRELELIQQGPQVLPKYPVSSTTSFH